MRYLSFCATSIPYEQPFGVLVGSSLTVRYFIPCFSSSAPARIAPVTLPVLKVDVVMVVILVFFISGAFAPNISICAVSERVVFRFPSILTVRGIFYVG